MAKKRYRAEQIVVRRLALAFFLGGLVMAGDYPRDDSLMKGMDPQVPAEFRDGTATLDQLHGWSRSLIQSDLRFSYRDADCDDREDVLVEIVFAGGTTGNQWFLLFSRGESGYRYIGTVDRILRTYSYEDECYLSHYGTAGGGEVTVSLHAVKNGKLSPLGSVRLRAGDGGNDHDRAVWDLLRVGAPTRDELLGIFRR